MPTANFSPRRAPRTRSVTRSLGGVGPVVAQMTQEAFGYKFHWAVADYLQRSARHIASKVDVEQAYAVGKAAVEFALKGKNAVMPIIVRKSSTPYRWSIGEAPLVGRSPTRKRRCRAISSRADGFGITAGVPALPAAADRRRRLPALPQRPAASMSTLKGAAFAKRLREPFVV